MDNQEILVQPDGRGRVLLTKVTPRVSSHYIAQARPDGSILLTPAIVRAKSSDKALALHPLLAQEIDEGIVSGDKGKPSELWEEVIKPSLVPEEQA